HRPPDCSALPPPSKQQTAEHKHRLSSPLGALSRPPTPCYPNKRSRRSPKDARVSKLQPWLPAHPSEPPTSSAPVRHLISFQVCDVARCLALRRSKPLQSPVTRLAQRA